MKKLIFLFLLMLFISCSANSMRKIDMRSKANWQELKFKNGKNVFWFDLDGENAIYEITISGKNSKKFGKPTMTPLVFVYNENLTEILESSKKENDLLVEIPEGNSKAKLQVIFSLGEVNGKCYIKINKLEGKAKDTFLKQDKKGVQEFNSGKFELKK